ncbi:MAG: alpha/beta hydrolase [Piscinibacter sp.]|nr:alpha/beta hydrolase [Piscinibacter sp.]
MNAQTERQLIAGPAGALECAIDRPPQAAVGLAVVCHPHPQHGGTLDNKVAQTLARAAIALGWRSVRFNFRGVGASAGVWDDGRGEIDDALAVIAAHRAPGEALLLAGFSFGAFVAASAAQRLPEDAKARRLALVGPSTQKQRVPEVPADTVVIHGEADDVVPLAATLDWARPQALPVIVFPGVGHFFHGQLALLKNTLVRQLQPAID